MTQTASCSGQLAGSRPWFPINDPTLAASPSPRFNQIELEQILVGGKSEEGREEASEEGSEESGGEGTEEGRGKGG